MSHLDISRMEGNCPFSSVCTAPDRAVAEVIWSTMSQMGLHMCVRVPCRVPKLCFLGGRGGVVDITWDPEVGRAGVYTGAVGAAEGGC